MRWKAELQNEFMVMKSLELLEGTVEVRGGLEQRKARLKQHFRRSDLTSQKLACEKDGRISPPFH